ncbi:MAG TPA: hypothetical protein VEL07_09020 [Planctomycetota bacterium]|nr:hypothetical protein [Planctomycetota bacterium]
MRSTLAPHVVVSLVAHGALVATLVGLVGEQRAAVARQEQRVEQDLRRTVARERAEAQAEREAGAAATLAAEVDQEIAALVREQVRDDALAAELERAVADSLARRLADAAAAAPIAGLDAAGRAALRDRLRADARADLGRAGAASRGAAIERLARAHARGPVARDVRERLRQLAAAVGDAVRDELDQGARAIAPADDAARRAAAGAALDGLDDPVQSAIDGAADDQVVPAAAAALARAAQEAMRAAGLDPAQDAPDLDRALEREIRAALDAGPRLADAGLTRARETFGAIDRATIATARRDVDAARAAAEAAAQAQRDAAGTLAATDPADRAAVAAAVAAQHALGGSSASALAATARAADAAAGASTAAAAQADRARAAAGGDAVAKAAQAADAISRGDRAAAAAAASDAATGLEEAASALAAIGDALAGAEAAAVAAAAARAEFAAALGAGAPATAVAALRDAAATRAGTAAAQAAPGAATAAADAVAAGIGQALAGSRRGGALGDLADLQARLDGADAAGARGNALAALGMGAAGGLFAGDGVGDGTSEGEAAIGEGDGAGAAALAVFNRAAYEAFVADLRDRASPANFYGDDTGAASGAVGDVLDTTRARAAAAPAPATAVAAERPARPVVAAAPRTVPVPDFPTRAFGAAPMVTSALTLDGDLADWGELTHGLCARFGPYEQVQLADGPTLHLRWSPDGLWMGYRIAKDPTAIVANPQAPYDGDCLELFIDSDNLRKPWMSESRATHQFCFDPFGFQGDATRTVCEIGRGLRGLPEFQQRWLDPVGARAVGLRLADGYSVEAFLPRACLASPRLIPGQYLAVNVSINQGSDWSLQRQWSASKAIETWNKPDTWGDVLLLGADAEATIAANDGGAHVVPGRPLAFTIADGDMNLSPRVIDRVLGSARVLGGGAPVAVVLEETRADSGVFRATIDTRSWALAPLAGELSLAGGDIVRLAYTDARAAFGEAGREVVAEIAVAHPLAAIGRIED